MSALLPVPASIGAPRSPQVDLMPVEVAKRRERGRSRMLVLLSLILFAGLLVGAVVWTDSQASSAEKALAAEVAKTDKLNAQIAEYSLVPQVQSELENARNARVYAGVFDTPWLEVWTNIVLSLPEGVVLDSAAWGTTTPLAQVAQGSSPFDGPSVGILTFEGFSLEYVAAADVVDQLNGIYGFTDALVSTTKREDDDGFVFYKYSGEVRFDAAVFTYRYSEEWFERVELFDAVVEARDAVELARDELLEAQRELNRIPADDTAARNLQEAVVRAAEDAVDDAVTALLEAQKALDEYDATVIAERQQRVEDARAQNGDSEPAEPSNGAADGDGTAEPGADSDADAEGGQS